MEYKTIEEMDAAADLAAVESAGIAGKYTDGVLMLDAVANWWKRWYMDAGHKRLARILLKYASK